MNFFNDDLPWDDAPAAVPRQLPQDPTLARIREQGTGVVETCPKCRGTGKFRSYSGRVLGDCFSCKGRGSKTFANPAPVRAANREKAVARAERQRASSWEEWKAANAAAAAWMERTAAKEGRFGETVADLIAAVRKYGDLTQGQRGIVERGLEREAQWARERAQKAQQAPSVDMGAIVAAFATARASGLRKVALHFPGLTLLDAPKKGAIYVKAAANYEAPYYGKIVDGRFFASRECPADVLGRLQVIAADPAAAAKTTGLETGVCVCCGAELTNPESVARGIGPICAGRWGF